MDRKIKMIIPVPVPEAALEAFSSQIPDSIIPSNTKVDFVCAAKGGGTLDSIYEGVIADAYCLEAGAHAEEEGYDAVCVNSMSDSGVAALRSRLSIPVVGTAQASYHLACQLGKKFSILSMWDRWSWLYDKVLREQGLEDRVASIKSIDVRPDTAELLAGKEDSVFPLLLNAARVALKEDGADVLVLGSTTMHQSHAYLSEQLSVPVLNPGLVGFSTSMMLLNLGITHSKRSFMPPENTIDDVLSKT